MNVPKLRFKGYKEDVWKKEKISNTSKIFDGTHETPNYIENGIKFISVENINNIYSSTKYISELDFEKYKIKPEKNNIFMTRIGDIGTSALYDGKEPLAYYVSLALIKTNIVPQYLNQYIKSNFFQKELYKRTIHVAFPKKINTGEIGNCEIRYPDTIEQIKIANMLQLLDKKIELQSKKIEALKLYKICTINNVFKTSDNSIYLKKLCNVKTSNISLNDIENDIGNYPLYGANGYIKNISSYQFNNDYVAIIKDGAGVGKTYICSKNSSILGTLNALFPIDIDINYLNILLTRIKFKKYIVGSGIPHIYFKDYKNELIKIHEKETQEIIGNYIEKLNSKILYEEKKYNKLIKLKKGLMQKMFV